MSDNREIFQENQLAGDATISRIEKLRELNETEEFINFLKMSTTNLKNFIIDAKVLWSAKIVFAKT